MAPPERIGRYELVARLGRGGMAEVFRARASGPMGFEKQLVVKRILPELADDESFVAMFLSEAKLVAQLDHPHIVQLFDFGEADGAYYLAMEWVDGLSLRQLIEAARTLGRPLPPRLCAKIAALVCEGLSFAHEATDSKTGAPLGLIHRDVSPDNILIGRTGAVKLADFGIAKVRNQAQVTRAGVIKGKLGYLSPEQIRGRPLDSRVDLFSLGAVLYQALTGTRPFTGKDELALMGSVLKERLVPVRERRPEVPAALERIVERALERDRDARYPSARELQRDLDRFIVESGEPLSTSELGVLVEEHLDAAPVTGDEEGESLRTEQVSARAATVPDSPAARPLTERLERDPWATPSDLSGTVPTDPVTDSLPPHSGPTDPDAAPASSAVPTDQLDSEPPLRAPSPGLPPPSAGGPLIAPAPRPKLRWSSTLVLPALAGAAVALLVLLVASRGEKPAARVEPPTAVEPRTADLVVESNVPGDVYVDGRRVGVTPLRARVPARELPVRLVNDALGLEKELRVQTSLAAPTRVVFQIGKGTLALSGAGTVRVDGRDLGPLPQPPLSLYEGPHEVELLDASGATLRRWTVRLAPGELRTVELGPAPEK